MGQRCGLLELLCLVLLGWTLVRGQAETDLQLDEEDGEAEDPPGTVKNVELQISCPEKCSCSGDGAVDCNGVSLTEFPQDLSQQTRQLSLQNNQITEVTLEHLSGLQQLETLNLQNNRLTTQGIDDEGFHILERLSYLYLANNKLTAAPKHLPPSLVSADFAANQLTKIYPDTFGQKPALKSVYLHNNKLTDAGLPENMFNGSNNLEILIMSSNFLRYVPKGLPTALYRLHLKNNKLEKIPAGVFDSLFHLRELYLQNNFLSNDGMDNVTFSHLNSLEYLDLSNNNLSSVPLGLPRNLILLHLEKNSIQSISANALKPIRNLEYLLLHNNHLRSDSIHPTAFQGLKRLHTVHMYNNLLERVPRGLPRRAKTLMLLHNLIGEIERNDLNTLYTLTELNLSYNRLTSARLHREAFRKLRILETLDLSGNKLQTLPLGLPKSLRVLKVKDNQMDEVPEGALMGMSSLRELYLTNNHLKLNSIYQGAWQELSALTTLDLSGNMLSHIPSDLPESLEFLHLQNNRISSVSATAFLNTPNIKGIFLRFNRLSVHSVSEESFSHLSRLQVLDIGHGNISPNRGDAGEQEEEDEEEELPHEEEEEERHS
ncbi:podocan-like [Carassius gibelio]|uniref:podocan-like n=1 Tax=Carassius gibelio TaxID=101364 RepID=UPI002279C1E1|nr:podocan-like [Carassius gibelio]XP_052397288.1 podocan-like [Carassius gibelio]XP_052397289.1 podocan-like [Carassius gibelio]